MKEHFVIDPLISKRQQLLLATQLCRMVLKVCPCQCFVRYTFRYMVTFHPSPIHSIRRVTRASSLALSLRFGEAGKRCQDVKFNQTLHATARHRDTNALCMAGARAVRLVTYSILCCVPDNHLARPARFSAVMLTILTD